jgi:hypothetical protein
MRMVDSWRREPIAAHAAAATPSTRGGRVPSESPRTRRFDSRSTGRTRASRVLPAMDRSAEDSGRFLPAPLPERPASLSIHRSWPARNVTPIHTRGEP